VRFIDEARIRVAAGDGGDGCVAFLHEKYRPMGGPSGGDGGSGGTVIAEARRGENTLYAYRNRRLLSAERGENGRGKSQHGKGGSDLILGFPPGTIISDLNTGELIADLTNDGDRAVLASGGNGGRGNARFATSTHQAPRRADAGTAGVELELNLELRLLADAGLLGLPNAGKSSLLSRVSAARPKVADYPFTTLEPILGVVSVGDAATFVLADIPGLIEGAHTGKGLGTTFLRHVERTSILVHLVDAYERDDETVLRDFDLINGELEGHSLELAAKPQIVVVSKVDLPETAERLESLRRVFAQRNIDVHTVSSATGEGCKDLMAAVLREVNAAKAAQDDEDA
jgi:GTP-binding protein